MAEIDYQFTYQDVPAERRIRMKFASRSKRQICAGDSTWPSAGVVSTYEGTSTGVYVFIGSQIYAYRDTEDWGYCPSKSCYHPLARGESLEGYLSYEGFGLPESEYLQTKVLRYKPQPFWCDQGRFLGK